jgi:hypothetical protein
MLAFSVLLAFINGVPMPRSINIIFLSVLGAFVIYGFWKARNKK